MMYVLDDFDHFYVFVNKFSSTLVRFCIGWGHTIVKGWDILIIASFTLFLQAIILIFIGFLLIIIFL